MVTKLETIDQDIEYFFKKLRMESLGDFPEAYSKKGDGDYLIKLAGYYEDIPVAVVRDLYKIYKWDFRLFDYDVKPFLRNKL